MPYVLSCLIYNVSGKGEMRRARAEAPSMDGSSTPCTCDRQGRRPEGKPWGHMSPEGQDPGAAGPQEQEPGLLRWIPASPLSPSRCSSSSFRKWPAGSRCGRGRGGGGAPWG